MTGSEFVQGLVDGTLPLNTIAEILAYDVTEVSRSRVVITCKPNGSHLNPAGTVHGGLSATLLDSCMGLAIRSVQEKGVSSTTLRRKASSTSVVTEASLLPQALQYVALNDRRGQRQWPKRSTRPPNLPIR
jgi:acyl-coenzyme A thioesterase PaaI-like protein